MGFTHRFVYAPAKQGILCGLVLVVVDAGTARGWVAVMMVDIMDQPELRPTSCRPIPAREGWVDDERT